MSLGGFGTDSETVIESLDRLFRGRLDAHDRFTVVEYRESGFTDDYLHGSIWHAPSALTYGLEDPQLRP